MKPAAVRAHDAGTDEEVIAYERVRFGVVSWGFQLPNRIPPSSNGCSTYSAATKRRKRRSLQAVQDARGNLEPPTVPIRFASPPPTPPRAPRSLTPRTPPSNGPSFLMMKLALWPAAENTLGVRDTAALKRQRSKWRARLWKNCAVRTAVLLTAIRARLIRQRPRQPRAGGGCAAGYVKLEDVEKAIWEVDLCQGTRCGSADFAFEGSKPVSPPS